MFFSSVRSGPEFVLSEVCLGTPEGTGCLQVGCQDLRPSDINSVVQDTQPLSYLSAIQLWDYRAAGLGLMLQGFLVFVTYGSLGTELSHRTEFLNEDPQGALCKVTALNCSDFTSYEQAGYMYVQRWTVIQGQRCPDHVFFPTWSQFSYYFF